MKATIVKRASDPRRHARAAKQGAAGEINTKFFDRKGRPLRSINAQIIGMELEDILRVRRSLRLSARGQARVRRFSGPSAGSIFDVLVIDEALAEQVWPPTRRCGGRRRRWLSRCQRIT